MKIIFFGAGSYTIPVVEKIKDQGLVLVVTSEEEGKLLDYLKTNNIPFIISRLKSSKDLEKIEKVEADLGVLASFGAILPKDIIEIFPLGILNIHPSLLPKHKGPSPIQSAILEGDSVTGVTIIKMDEKVDHGPIVAQKEVKMPGNGTFETAAQLLFTAGADLINEIVQMLAKDSIVEIKQQDRKGESWTQKIEKKDGEIDADNPPSLEVLKRKIRAFYPWPGVHLTISINGKSKLLKLMPFDMVQVEGKNKMTYKDFINGYGKEAKEILQKLSLI